MVQRPLKQIYIKEIVPAGTILAGQDISVAAPHPLRRTKIGSIPGLGARVLSRLYVHIHRRRKIAEAIAELHKMTISRPREMIGQDRNSV